MHRAMKDARCSKIALRAAKLYRCPACASSHRPRTSGAPAAEIRATTFGEVIYIDLATFNDVDGNNPTVFLVIVDAATSFGLAAPFRRIGPSTNPRPTAEMVEEVYTDSWRSWARAPRAIHADLDTAFKATFPDGLELEGTLVIPVARGAHHQLGHAERRILTTRVQVDAVVIRKTSHHVEAARPCSNRRRRR